MLHLSWHRRRRTSELATAESAVRRHFHPIEPEQLVAASRTFPATARVDLQVALEKLLGERYGTQPLGIHVQHHYETVTIAHVLHTSSHSPVVIGPLQHDEVDVGETLPARCLKQGLWLARDGTMPFAVLLSPASQHGSSLGVFVEVVVPAGSSGLEFSRRFLDQAEGLVQGAASYRGKVLSLERLDDYSGRVGGIRVHKLRQVRREDVVLPSATLDLLESNIFAFLEARQALRKLGLPTKKGLLFYGPPGTGKTHTLHYLASRLPDHTTLLITAEQVGLLDTYFQLARFLQPALVVIEDVDLIARAREDTSGPCAESLLNKLLNEMDGLREDAALLFILTTNRPDQLEAALASRPGRVDQAIEFPLPDSRGRRQLVRLYSGSLPITDEVVEAIVRRTDGASAAFVKELMRRAAQFSLNGGGALASEHVSAALEEMVFRGGSLNLRLLGGAADAGRGAEEAVAGTEGGDS
jgi:hypothetical protein